MVKPYVKLLHLLRRKRAYRPFNFLDRVQLRSPSLIVATKSQARLPRACVERPRPGCFLCALAPLRDAFLKFELSYDEQHTGNVRRITAVPHRQPH